MPRLSDDRLEERRRAILDGARRAFARHGYEGATVRLLETETGLSRGAIFHHFADKESLFLALAAADAEATAARVREAGLVQVMRELPAVDPGWLAVRAEAARRLRTDAAFAARFAAASATVDQAVRERLVAGRDAGTLRADVPPAVLGTLLRLVLDGLVLRRARGEQDDPEDLARILDLVEDAVRDDARAAGGAPRRHGRRGQGDDGQRHDERDAG